MKRLPLPTLSVSLALLAVISAVPISAQTASYRQVLAQRLSDDVLRFEQDDIVMADGTSLAADLYRPNTNEAVPVLFEFLPYRKEEDRAYRWHLYRYFVERGYAIARVDIRGTGSSDGTLPHYEYSEIEQDDAVEVIEWLADQAWSNGRVGMFGISWGGFNAIHLGMRAPEPLRAILAACATDDLFYDDVHYIDGLMHVDQYEISQDLANAVVATPELVLDETALRNRFDTKPWFLIKLEHPNDGPFWDRGSLASDYTRLQVPAFLIGGYYDGYRDSIARILENAEVDIEALLGPWPHRYPHDATPGPQIEWRDQAVTFFDRYLKGGGGHSNSVQPGKRQPRKRLTYFQRRWHPPGKDLARVPGEWRQIESWPGQSEKRDEPKTLEFELAVGGALHPAAPARSVPAASWASVPAHTSAGFEAGTWWGDLQPDQQALDDTGLVFETPPLQKGITVLGFAQARLGVDPEPGSRPTNWFVRLSDVAPGTNNTPGAVTLVTGAAAQHDPKSGEFSIELHLTSWTFEPGHRIRLSIASSQWPMVWPLPRSIRQRVATDGRSTLRLPLAPESVIASHLTEPTPFVPYPVAAPAEATVATEQADQEPEARGGPPGWQSSYDASTGVRTTTWRSGYSSTFDWAPFWDRVQRSHRATTDYTASDRRPWTASIAATTSTRFDLEKQDRHQTLEWFGEFELTSDKKFFRYRYTRKLFVDGQLEREKSWRRRVARGKH